jgi:hypothetical protein
MQSLRACMKRGFAALKITRSEYFFPSCFFESRQDRKFRFSSFQFQTSTRNMAPDHRRCAYSKFPVSSFNPAPRFYTCIFFLYDFAQWCGTIPGFRCGGIARQTADRQFRLALPRKVYKKNIHSGGGFASADFIKSYYYK